MLFRASQRLWIFSCSRDFGGLGGCAGVEMTSKMGGGENRGNEGEHWESARVGRRRGSLSACGGDARAWSSFVRGRQEKAEVEESSTARGEKEPSPLMTRGEEKAEPSPLMTRGEVRRAGKEAKGTVEQEEKSEEREYEDWEDWELEEGEEDDEEEYENWSYPGLAVELGNQGIILVLFETPSGFALFTYDGVKLLRPGAIEHVWTDFIKFDRTKTLCWLDAFQAFEDKSSAINRNTGVNYQLAKMITDHIKTDQKLAVGSPEYKEIIEETMGISCLHDDTVMELMWGLKNCMHHFLPAEIEDDRPLMSEGLRRVLHKCHLDYKPEIIDGHILEMAFLVFNYDYCLDKHSESLCEAGKHLKDISGIDSEGWDLFKLATALKIVCYPEDIKNVPPQMFSEDELRNMQRDAPRYKDKLMRKPVQIVYEDIMWALGLKNKWLGPLACYLKDAEEAYKAKQAMI